MERLTEKQNGVYILPYDEENLLSVSTSSHAVMIDDFKWATTPRVTCLSGKFIDKLGELEDVLEKHKIKNLDEYISALIEARNFAIKERNTNFSRYIKETIKNEELETELAELKQKAIVPKYKTGDKVYGIIDTWAYTDVLPIEIRGICLLYEVWDGENTTKQHYTRIFATKEEAEQKLVKLKGKE